MSFFPSLSHLHFKLFFPQPGGRAPVRRSGRSGGRVSGRGGGIRRGRLHLRVPAADPVAARFGRIFAQPMRFHGKAHAWLSSK